MSWGISSVSDQHIPSGGGQAPRCWSSSPEHQVPAVCPLCVCAPTPSTGTFVLKGRSAGQEGLARALSVGWGVSAPVRVPVPSLSPASGSTKTGFPHLSRCHAGSELALSPTALPSPSRGSLRPSVELSHGARGAAQTLARAGEKLARVPDSFNLFLLPWFWKAAGVCAPFRGSLGFSQPCYLPHWFPN